MSSCITYLFSIEPIRSMLGGRRRRRRRRKESVILLSDIGRIASPG